MIALVIAEHRGGRCDPAVAKVISCALQCAPRVQVCVIGYRCQAIAEYCAQFSGVEKVYLLDDPLAEHSLAERECQYIASLLTPEITHILAAAGTYGKNLLPRLAGVLRAIPVTDVIEVHSAQEFTRPIYAGNALERIRVSAFPIVMTVRANRFAAVKNTEQPAVIESRQSALQDVGVEFVAFQEQVSARPELTQARIVVAGGRGLQNKEQFKLVETLADLLNAAVGATRAAVDAGIVSNDHQVGQTGKSVAPDLYIAIGISGAIQHLAGMKESRVIVAINQDPAAPIFDIADYALVGDLFTLVPEMISQLHALRGLPAAPISSVTTTQSE